MRSKEVPSTRAWPCLTARAQRAHSLPPASKPARLLPTHWQGALPLRLPQAPRVPAGARPHGQSAWCSMTASSGQTWRWSGLLCVVRFWAFSSAIPFGCRKLRDLTLLKWEQCSVAVSFYGLDMVSAMSSERMEPWISISLRLPPAPRAAKSRGSHKAKPH